MFIVSRQGSSTDCQVSPNSSGQARQGRVLQAWLVYGFDGGEKKMSDGASSGEMGSNGRSSFIDITQARGEFSIPSKRNNFPIAILSRAFGSFSFDLKSKGVVWGESWLQD